MSDLDLRPGDALQYQHNGIWLDAVVVAKIQGLLAVGIDAKHPEVAELMESQEFEGRELKITLISKYSPDIRPPF